jgi:hypothetical protein
MKPCATSSAPGPAPPRCPACEVVAGITAMAADFLRRLVLVYWEWEDGKGKGEEEEA